MTTSSRGARTQTRLPTATAVLCLVLAASLPTTGCTMTWERTTRAQLAASGSVQPRVRVVTGGETLVVEQARVDGHLLRGRVRGGAPVALDLTHVESIALRRRASEPTDALIGVGILAVCVAAFGAVMVASSSANHEPPSPPPSSSATLRSNDALALLYLFAILFGGP